MLTLQKMEYGMKKALLDEATIIKKELVDGVVAGKGLTVAKENLPDKKSNPLVKVEKKLKKHEGELAHHTREMDFLKSEMK